MKKSNKNNNKINERHVDMSTIHFADYAHSRNDIVQGEQKFDVDQSQKRIGESQLKNEPQLKLIAT